jgi:hypothetical protein
MRIETRALSSSEVASPQYTDVQALSLAGVIPKPSVFFSKQIMKLAERFASHDAKISMCGLLLGDLLFQLAIRQLGSSEFTVPNTARLAPWGWTLEGDLGCPAVDRSKIAPRVESASLRPRPRTGNVPWNAWQQIAVDCMVGIGCKQRTRVRVKRSTKNVRDICLLDDLPCVHDDHAVAQVGNHAPVMSNQEDGHFPFVL